MYRVMMIAGEPSGDLHGSGVVRELRERAPGVDIFGVGGDGMKAEGMDLLFHINSLSVMGFTEVIRHLPALRRIEQTLERALVTRKPEVVVLIDYPGFNLRFARKARQHPLKLLYYISPQVWAWNRGRVKVIKSLIDQMNVIFPFEVDLYRNEGVPVDFVGHPLAEQLRSGSNREDFFRRTGLQSDRKLIALLPGSRKQEVHRILPRMLQAVSVLQSKFPVQAAIGAAPALSRGLMNGMLGRNEHVSVLENDTYGLMEHADVAIVASGTATLETGWFGTPMVIVYRTSPLTYLIGRRLVRVPYIGLVNIVCGRKVVPELIQHEMSVESLVTETGRMLTDRAYAERIRADLGIVRSALGGPGASSRVAENIISLAKAA